MFVCVHVYFTARPGREPESSLSIRSWGKALLIQVLGVFLLLFFFFFFNHIELKYLEKPFVLSLSNESFALLKQEEKTKKTHTDHSYFSS